MFEEELGGSVHNSNIWVGVLLNDFSWPVWRMINLVLMVMVRYRWMAIHMVVMLTLMRTWMIIQMRWCSRMQTIHVCSPGPLSCLPIFLSFTQILMHPYSCHSILQIEDFNVPLSILTYHVLLCIIAYPVHPYAVLCISQTVHWKSKFLIVSDAEHAGEFQYKSNLHLFYHSHWAILCNRLLSLAKHTCVTQISGQTAR